MNDNNCHPWAKHGLTTAQIDVQALRLGPTSCWARIVASRPVMAYLIWHWCECQNTKYADGESLQYYVTKALSERYGSLKYGIVRTLRVSPEMAETLIGDIETVDWELILTMFRERFEIE